MRELFKNVTASHPLLILLGVLLVVIGYGAYAYWNLGTVHQKLQAAYDVQAKTLADEQQRSANLQIALEGEQERLRNLGEQVEDLTGTIDDLEKLNELDPELLQKYSKIYFLNEHYTPPKLADIDKDFLYDESVKQQIHREVESFLEDMIEDALADDVELYVRSAYRSFGTQSTLKSGYAVSYGSGANTFSADQGYSEHQLGTTLDFTTTGLNGGLDGFQTTTAYEWLQENAYRYGFILSYPQGNAYYQFEPWHWRFVGKDLARYLQKQKINFYDLDQRKIDAYLLEIFD